MTSRTALHIGSSPGRLGMPERTGTDAAGSARDLPEHAFRMSWVIRPPLDVVFRRREADEATARLLDRARRTGAASPIARGSYAASEAWATLNASDAHAQRVWEAAARLRPGTVFSHHAAAAVLGIDLIDAWPRAIDVTTATSAGSSGVIRRHHRPLERDEVMPWGEHFLTTPARTVVDLASVLPFVGGVVAADQALWQRRPSGALCTRHELEAAASRYRGRAHARVAAVSTFATGLSDSVRESESRVLIDRLGFPTPTLQQRFVLPDGRDAFADFWWPDHDHIGEFDGTGKYLDPVMRRGRTPEQALIAEKDRGDALRRQVRALSRWRTPHLRSPRLLYDILRTDGLPSTRPRPGR
ncbi:type IV toxin-antitoxin system AbiEi family antitoxin domain-containing protein [Microbacterium arborescens]|uniref:type IV toxin-antitoxin system AbiEi family antitoxin domain-containing protein n=1 Tax=Microbacterium arborescens TaxID=33883 RepID=UPI0013B47383|nr:hypothetical protein [Microbacterium arborescens]